MRDEERIARELAEMVTSRCAESGVTVEAGSVLCNVQARRGGRTCAINCY